MRSPASMPDRSIARHVRPARPVSLAWPHLREALALAAIVLALVSAHGAALAQTRRVPQGEPLAMSDPADLSPARRTLLDLYMTSKQAARALREHKDLLLVDVRQPEVTAASGVPSVEAVRVPLLVPVAPVGAAVATVPSGHAPSADGGEGAAPVWRLNPDLVGAIEAAVRRRGGDRSSPVMVICVPGIHSGRAVDLLADAGFTRVYSVVDGFEGIADPARSLGGRGWKADGLPWHRLPANQK